MDWLVLDVETCPMPDCGVYLTDPVDAPSNYKDPVKIAAYISEKRQRQIDDAALDMDLCEVVAVGVHSGDSGRQILTRIDRDERELLSLVWRLVHDFTKIVTFNGMRFDLPVLQRRSLYLDVSQPTLNLDRYRAEQVVDLSDILSYHGRAEIRSLAFYAKRFGIPHDTTVTGADVPRLVAEGAWDAIRAHVEHDVETTLALARRIGALPRLRQVLAKEA